MDDQTLLARYAETRDADAFEVLVQRHAGLVKASCLRILGNSHDAEEAAQECFLELARHAELIHSSVVGWLLRAAHSRSLNMLRSRMCRRVRERDVSRHVESSTKTIDATNVELNRIIETGLKDLPDDLRRPMILHYFDGRSQREVATELGVNQSTISRRMRDALQQLREKLTQAGYVASAPAITVLMPDKAALASSGYAGTKASASALAGKAAATATSVSSSTTLTAAALSIFSYLVFGGWISLLVAICLTLYVVRYQPAWVRDVYSSLGVPDDRQPTFRLTKWNWTTPPQGWRTEIVCSLTWSALFFCLAFAFAARTEQARWGTVVAATLVGIVCGVQAFRILHRVGLVHRFPTINANQMPSTDAHKQTNNVEPVVAWMPNVAVSWLDAIQRVGSGIAGVGITLRLVLSAHSRPVWPSMMLAGLIGTWMLMTGVRLCGRLLLKQRDRADSLEPHQPLASQMPSPEITTSPETRHWQGIQSVLTAGVMVVVGLSVWTVCNPSAVRGLSVSLAAIQTSMLGWMVYRVAANCRRLEFSLVRRVALIVLASCFMLNSGVCLANWLQ